MLACSHSDIDAKCQPCGTFPAQPDTPRPLYRSGAGPHLLGHRAEPHVQDGGNPDAGRVRSLQVLVGTACSRLQNYSRYCWSPRRRTRRRSSTPSRWTVAFGAVHFDAANRGVWQANSDAWRVRRDVAFPHRLVWRVRCDAGLRAMRTLPQDGNFRLE